MILKDKKSDLDAIQYACAVTDMICTPFTIETNSDMVQVEILDRFGEEPSPEIAYRLGRIASIKAEIKS